MVNSVKFMFSEEYFTLGPRTRLDYQELLCSRVLLKYEKGTEKTDIDIKMGMKSAPLASL